MDVPSMQTSAGLPPNEYVLRGNIARHYRSYPFLYLLRRARSCGHLFLLHFAAISRGGLGNFTKSAVIELIFRIKKKKIGFKSIAN